MTFERDFPMLFILASSRNVKSGNFVRDRGGWRSLVLACSNALLGSEIEEFN